MATDDGAPYRFPGVSAPTYTQVPDVYLDELMPLLSGAEWKVLCYIVRRTFGWKKHADDISLQQMCRGIRTRDGRILDRGTGLTEKTVVAALRSLEEKHIVEATRRRDPERGDLPTTYAPTFVDNSARTHWNNVRRGGAETPDGRLTRFQSQQTGSQDTENNRVEPFSYERYVQQ